MCQSSVRETCWLLWFFCLCAVHSQDLLLDRRRVYKTLMVGCAPAPASFSVSCHLQGRSCRATCMLSAWHRTLFSECSQKSCMQHILIHCWWWCAWCCCLQDHNIPIPRHILVNRQPAPAPGAHRVLGGVRCGHCIQSSLLWAAVQASHVHAWQLNDYKQQAVYCCLASLM